MNDSKPWYMSVGVWGAVVGLIGSTLSLLKVQVDPTFLSDLREWLFSLATLIGTGVALYGRLRASQRIGATPNDGGTSPGSSAPSSGASANRVPLILLLASSVTLAALLSGCAAAPSGAYVAADRATYEAVAPEYAAYVAQDPLLGPDQRDRRERTLEAWDLRLKSAERTTK